MTTRTSCSLANRVCALDGVDMLYADVLFEENVPRSGGFRAEALQVSRETEGDQGFPTIGERVCDSLRYSFEIKSWRTKFLRELLLPRLLGVRDFPLLFQHLP